MPKYYYENMKRSYVLFASFLILMFIFLSAFVFWGRDLFIDYVDEIHGRNSAILEDQSGEIYLKNGERDKNIFLSETPTNLPIDDGQIEADEIKDKFFEPMDNIYKRITKKPFGILIIPRTSPIQPERFSGYHTGADFEVFDDEQNRDVEIMTVCGGSVLEKRFVSGYGGTFVQSCEIGGDLVTVLYGHLNLESIEMQKGQTIEAGQKIGILGDGDSSQTDFERKHLHLAIRKGGAVDYRGYINSSQELEDWIDPCDVFPCGN